MAQSVVCLCMLLVLQVRGGGCEGGGGGDLEFYFHGGMIVFHPIKVYPVWYGSWSEEAREVVRQAITSLTPEEPISQTPNLANWWKIVSQYRDDLNISVTNKVELAAECSDRYSEGKLLQVGKHFQPLYRILNHTFIAGFNPNISCSPSWGKDYQGLYHFFFSTDVLLDGDECGDAGTRVPSASGPRLWVSWARRSAADDKQCNQFSFPGSHFLGSPNADTGLDAMVSTLLANIAAVATGPNGDGWADAELDNLAELCAFVYGAGLRHLDYSYQTAGLALGEETTQSMVLNDLRQQVSYNLYGVNNSRFLVQQLYSLQDRSCLLQLSDTCQAIHSVIQPFGVVSWGVVVNNSYGLQTYSPGLQCTWLIQVPGATSFAVTPTFVSLTPGLDYVSIFQTTGCDPGSGAKPPQFPHACLLHTVSASSLEMAHLHPPLSIAGNQFLLYFTTDLRDLAFANATGWAISYEAAYCERLVVLESLQGHVYDGSPVGSNYSSGQNCSWLLSPPDNKTRLVFLNFTHFDTQAGEDVVSVWVSRGSSGHVKEAEISGAVGQISLPPFFTRSLLITFQTSTRNGEGWSAEYAMVDQAPSPSPSPSSAYHATNAEFICCCSCFSLVLLFLTSGYFL